MTHHGQLNPVADVAEYLSHRPAVMHWDDEQGLFIKLPGELRAQVKKLQAAAELALKLVKAKYRVTVAVKSALLANRDLRVNAKTFRNLYDLWIAKKDWTVFVNRAKAGAVWQLRTDSGLPDAFLDYCAARIGAYKRDDARKEALRSIKRQWLTGRTMAGNTEAVPGYGFAVEWWAKHQRPVNSFPIGWHYTNIMRALKARNKLPEAARRMLLHGTAAAKDYVPDVIMATKDLRFLEEVQFDDVKTDWRIFNPATGQAEDLWLLIARDRATRMLLGFGMRPARVREDGTQEHLKLRDMKQLCGWLLERYGLPPYLMTWKIERGTATLSEGSAAALREQLSPDRIRISYSSMIGGTSPAGYFERRIGNSKGKASLESHNRGLHMIGAALPGQTGPSYGARPADLLAREKESREIALLSEFLPAHLRGQLGYSLLTLGQARQALFNIFSIQNHRDDHTMEGFDEILEWYCDARQTWEPQNTIPDNGVKGLPLRKRMERPIERAARLCHGLTFTPVSPEIITAFYEHTQRRVKIEPTGEIEFTFEGSVKYFKPVAPHKLAPGTRLLGYHHQDDPLFLHLTDGRGGIVGTWLQRGRVNSNDADAIAQAIAYQQRAMNAARDRANELAAPERAELEALRARNAEVMKLGDFVEVTPAGAAIRKSEMTSAVATGLRAVKKQKKVAAEEKQNLADLEDEANSAL